MNAKYIGVESVTYTNVGFGSGTGSIFLTYNQIKLQ
jgi:hypothetical protein